MSNHIQLNLHDINQLFNTIDPSPFHEKDLDQDAEDFILGWAQEFPLDESIDLIVHLEQLPERQNAKELIERAIHNYFAYRWRFNQLEFKRLMKLGRTSLMVGLSFLGVCLLLTQLLMNSSHGLAIEFIEQGLTIVGWVAMWRPMEIYLYEWWPVRHRGRVFKKLSEMPIQVRKIQGTDPESRLT